MAKQNSKNKASDTPEQANKDKGRDKPKPNDSEAPSHYTVTFTYVEKKDDFKVKPKELKDVEKGDVVTWVSDGHDVEVQIQPPMYFGPGNSKFVLETGESKELTVVGGPHPSGKGFGYIGRVVGDDKPRGTGENEGRGMP